MRSQSANLIYQNSLILIYLKAVEEALGKVEVEVENAINKGLYTEIKTAGPLTAKDVRCIEQHMRQIVADDVPFVKESLTKDEAIARFYGYGLPRRRSNFSTRILK